MILLKINTFNQVKIILISVVYLIFFNLSFLKGQPTDPAYLKTLQEIDGFVALWDFKEETGESRYANNSKEYPLKDAFGSVERVNEGPLSGYSAHFDGESYLILDNKELGKLDITSPGVTVIAWVKWTGGQTGFVAGTWNEYEDGGKRQYGLFISLPYYNGQDQVCGHISKTGKATPPFPYSIDYSASKRTVPTNEWSCIGFTYDGEYIKSYLNGIFEPREEELINHTKGFEGYPDGLKQSKNPYYFPDGIGSNGSDFTVGSVFVHGNMGNFYKGLIGGIVVFSRSLTEEEMSKINNTIRLY